MISDPYSRHSLLAAGIAWHPLLRPYEFPEINLCHDLGHNLIVEIDYATREYRCEHGEARITIPQLVVTEGQLDYFWVGLEEWLVRIHEYESRPRQETRRGR